VPAVRSSLLEPVWIQFAALLEQPEFAAGHSWGCHRRRIADRIVFEHIVAALVHGSGYERIAGPGCSATTIQLRARVWSGLGLAPELHRIVLAAYGQMIGLDLDGLAVDGCHTKAPCEGEKAGPSPVDRAKQGLKRSTCTDAKGVPLGIASAGANRHDSRLLDLTLHPAARRSANCPRTRPSTSARPTTADPAGRCWTNTAWPARSPPKASRRRSRSASAGWSNPPSPG